ncbi:tRNA (guanosine(46)-N7)-methyltransferase TrmB [Synechococcales cyanobacterium C]|uniref:tRNA (guanine-N(7)-)-methyltransferase n=1 Tax=Petrachloros mirabilis ULC683 TaxID=2781853 RepID=A0A8K2A2R3_9CYAN|nr:tRNA (guanosine(46)-N7)-methyltransferase TrmB [Petrachloros mirabilis]NCJ08557.1 tRNA (guanosine(46)-N7)-methyltransferase TrmB [Petrachloros mirabilis ULC683]
MTIVRVRQHVNPLSAKYQEATAAPDWAQIYAHRTRPLHLDIGCARGQFLLAMAQAWPDWNFLGVEIREPLVIKANQDRDALGLSNLHYLFCNINPSLRSLLLPQSLQGASIQFPDPWFKRRHQKRRVLRPELVADLARCLQPGSLLFLQSDVLEVAAEMRHLVGEHPDFRPQPHGWLEQNPFPVPTERETLTLKAGQPVYRCQFLRC